jgi:predicted DNA-binding protein with PD1-like motif
LELSRLDSLYQLEEEEEAHLPVVLSRRGAICSGGAMVRRMVPELFVGLEEKGEERRWRREEGENRGGWWLGFGRRR